jgi:hypothetical protein
MNLLQMGGYRLAAGVPSAVVAIVIDSGYRFGDRHQFGFIVEQHAQRGTWKCPAVACVYPRLVCGVTPGRQATTSVVSPNAAKRQYIPPREFYQRKIRFSPRPQGGHWARVVPRDVHSLRGELHVFIGRTEKIAKNKEDEFMKYSVLLLVLCCFLIQIPAIAQVPQSPVGQSIEGTWISQLTDASGNLHLFEVGTFSPDGSYTGANVNGLHSTHKGVWERTGHRKFALTVLFFTHDAQGTFNGIVRARIAVTLAEDLNSYDSVAERTVMDTSGNILSVNPGIVGHAVRMELLPPPE